jgi:glycogen debranching enzyme
MGAISSSEMFDRAVAILRENDRGTYTVPTKGLYPFQWNWDSCLTALGFAAFDEARAWTEIETLFAHQWPDGMVPHIVFHRDDEGYFPGPQVWRTGRPVATSGITQPPVAAFAVRRIFERVQDREMARRRARALLGRIDRWHQWFFAHRDPAGEGLVAIIHPWESGRDNSVDWDEAFERVPTEGIAAYQRRDLQHAAAEHRPTKEQYDRYLWLVERFRSLGWDNAKLHDASPFRVVDPGFNAILMRSCADLAALAGELGETEIAARNAAFATRGIAAMERLWSNRHGQYLCHDRVSDNLIDSASVGGLIAAFAAISKQRSVAIARRIGELASRSKYIVPSHDPADPRFDAKRYWRGPAWLIVNYLIADGLENGGESRMAETIRASSMELISKSGFAEYYDPVTGEACGGGRFTWTAAMVLEFLRGK